MTDSLVAPKGTGGERPARADARLDQPVPMISETSAHHAMQGSGKVPDPVPRKAEGRLQILLADELLVGLVENLAPAVGSQFRLQGKPLLQKADRDRPGRRVLAPESERVQNLQKPPGGRLPQAHPQGPIDGDHVSGVDGVDETGIEMDAISGAVRARTLGGCGFGDDGIEKPECRSSPGSPEPHAGEGLQSRFDGLEPGHGRAPAEPLADLPGMKDEGIAEGNAASDGLVDGEPFESPEDRELEGSWNEASARAGRCREQTSPGLTEEERFGIGHDRTPFQVLGNRLQRTGGGTTRASRQDGRHGRSLLMNEHE